MGKFLRKEKWKRWNISVSQFTGVRYVILYCPLTYPRYHYYYWKLTFFLIFIVRAEENFVLWKFKDFGNAAEGKSSDKTKSARILVSLHGLFCNKFNYTTRKCFPPAVGNSVYFPSSVFLWETFSAYTNELLKQSFVLCWVRDGSCVWGRVTVEWIEVINTNLDLHGIFNFNFLFSALLSFPSRPGGLITQNLLWVSGSTLHPFSATRRTFIRRPQRGWTVSVILCCPSIGRNSLRQRHWVSQWRKRQQTNVLTVVPPLSLPLSS